jgi:hypothetical protein
VTRFVAIAGKGAPAETITAGLAPKQIGNHGGDWRRLPSRPAPINLHILSLDVARRLQAFSEPFHVRRDLTTRIHAEEADQWRRPALRARVWGRDLRNDRARITNSNATSLCG